uniref:Uncharacterized protein n=1 Tax=Caenorhabditis japonica TaxID=281687 RepID=A0A8R1EM13_CAEJA
MIHERHATPFEATKREEQCERTFRCVFPFLSNSIMAVQNDENNTLINLAINAQYVSFYSVKSAFLHGLKPEIFKIVWFFLYLHNLRRVSIRMVIFLV